MVGDWNADKNLHTDTKTVTSEKHQVEIRTFFLPMAINDSTEEIYCLFSQGQVVEILGPRPIQKIPYSPEYLKGVVHYDNKLLPVINLDDLCNQKHQHGQERYPQLLVIRTGSVDLKTGEPLKAVVAASRRIRITKISGQELETAFVEREAPPSIRDSGVLRGFFQRQAESIVVFDLGPMVQGTLEKCLGEMHH